MARAVFYETGISKETSASTEIQSQKLSKSPSGDHLATSENDASLGEQIASKSTCGHDKCMAAFREIQILDVDDATIMVKLSWDDTCWLNMTNLDLLLYTPRLS